MADDIARHRAEIDALDAKLVELLNRRAAHARAIGQLKPEGTAYRPEREAQVLRRVAASGNGPLSPEAITRLFAEIMSACRSLEQPLAIAYLGPEGTFSEMAMTRHFGGAVRGAPCASIDEVFRAAEAGSANYAVAPVENSTEGTIGRTLDLLLATPLRICGEVVLRIQQNLLGRQAQLDEIRKVYSHAQSLGQCHLWLAQHLPRAERISVSSNAEAALIAGREEAAAAIGPDIAAERYGLQVLARSIEDDPRNKTRFLVLGPHDAAPTGKDRTSLVMTAYNRPGAVHDLISPLARHGVSMTRLESRPARTGQWEYYFYVDVEGHEQDAQVAAALSELRSKAPFVKIFGSYPAAAG